MDYWLSKIKTALKRSKQNFNSEADSDMDLKWSLSLYALYYKISTHIWILVVLATENVIMAVLTKRTEEIK